MSTASSLSAAPNRQLSLALGAAARAALWIAWLLTLLFWVPRVERVIRLYNVKMPSSAELVVALSHGLVPFGLFVALAFIALDGSITYRLRRAGTRSLWSGLMTFAPVAAIIFTTVALSQPLLLILEALSKP